MQGQVSTCLATDKFGTHSRFLFTGTGLSFKQWRFAIRARLNLLYTRWRTAQFSRSHGGDEVPGERDCRICGRQQETVQHVLCCCIPLMTAITARHNAILDRLIRAMPPSARFDREKCPIPNTGPTGLKPDLTVWREDGHVVIVDVRCSYENDETALERAFDEKVYKYTDLAREVAAKIPGVRSVAVRPFISGSLGGWLPVNEHCLVELRQPVTLLLLLPASAPLKGTGRVRASRS